MVGDVGILFLFSHMQFWESGSQVIFPRSGSPDEQAECVRVYRVRILLRKAGVA